MVTGNGGCGWNGKGLTQVSRPTTKLPKLLLAILFAQGSFIENGGKVILL